MSTARIVLIEDNPADVFLIEMALAQNGIIYQMTRFENGEEALKALCPPGRDNSRAPVPDAILLDLNTPKSDGFEVLRKLRETPYLTGVPVAIVTSSQAASDKHRTDLIGATRYIEKPSQLEEFLAKVGQGVREMLEMRL